MEEFLKGYFVQHKQLIFEKLGILTLKIVPAYFDKQHQQLFPAYFNYSFVPKNNLTNNTVFFDALSKKLNISHQEAELLYKNFVCNLKEEFEKKASFTILNFVTISQVNNAYLVAIDSNLQMVFNPIAVHKPKIKNKKKSTSFPVQTIAPEKTLSTITPLKNISTNPVQHISITPPPLEKIAKKEVLPNTTIQTDQPTIKNKGEKPLSKLSLSQKKEMMIAKKIVHSKKNNRSISYLLAIIVIIAIALIVIRFFLNDSLYLSSLWK